MMVPLALEGVGRVPRRVEVRRGRPVRRSKRWEKLEAVIDACGEKRRREGRRAIGEEGEGE